MRIRRRWQFGFGALVLVALASIGWGYYRRGCELHDARSVKTRAE